MGQAAIKKQEERQQLWVAAEALFTEYAEGGELTDFTVLDSEDWQWSWPSAETDLSPAPSA